jgi:glutamate synthase domain-containing protein 2
MAKAIICGADLVAADTALLTALGCRVCRNAHSLNIDETAGCLVKSPQSRCPVNIESIDSVYAARRITNLMGSWHGQLIEVLGAMGIREVRRLRGEMGRAIFMEEIEKESFGDLLRVTQEQEIA